jgi:hypothetical protein
LVIVAPVASIVRVQPSVVWRDSLLPSIFAIVMATWPLPPRRDAGAYQPGPSSGWPGTVDAWAPRAEDEPPEATPKANAPTATTLRRSAPTRASGRQVE